jgi:[CysO sulfur-carrier protein]-S-L-cysteine hydrolase
VRFPRALLDEIVQHARQDLPNECCGLVAAQDGVAVKVFPATNVHASPLRFEIDGREVLKVQNEIDERGWTLGSLYHSHTKSAAYPSQTDVNFAEFWPGLTWLIVSLEDPDEPSMRTFEIGSGDVSEQELEIDG